MIKPKYKYLPKKWIMNRNEHDFYKVLNSLLDPKYVVIPQVHLDELVETASTDKKSKLFSFRHIDQKSVDFAICNKKSMHPVCAVELDGWSHLMDKTKVRDVEVERILGEAGVPLLRFENSKNYVVSDIQASIKNSKLDRLLKPEQETV